MRYYGKLSSFIFEHVCLDLVRKYDCFSVPRELWAHF
jgi:hypothetical protein